ncbi:conserved hypothetical protein [Burkholderia pseudomallei 1106b]|uniref:Uncharacterized protein n=2 Tax=Burkholderia pseudomallei TaxID=28450 RepID=A0AAX0U5D4_BURPE|nr:conserved hypothetical protein [Burkholderia pseudomallei 1106a]AFR18564.1 hypothetical protein BPC006_II0632 [Burkholderia pseudomallei BPC006]ARL53710.1 hypothetical protein BOC51_28860 [Burkholderia pseudomallei]EES20828.1 conserved hypothetical protein [Burkholderia pseudomallei 1106b]AUL59758.1 hypothetical protein BHT10_28985 [Burkholderia pseudomallei]
MSAHVVPRVPGHGAPRESGERAAARQGRRAARDIGISGYRDIEQRSSGATPQRRMLRAAPRVRVTPTRR